jgi:hypothetical protein
VSAGSPSELRHFEQRFAGGVRERGAGSRRELRGLFVLLTLLVVAGVVAGVLPAGATVRVYLLVVVAAGAVVVVAGTLSRFDRIERVPRRRGSRALVDVPLPPFFERTQRRLELASTSIAQFEQLRPRLREIAEQRLAGHGLRLRSDAAKGVLGEEAWLLLDRPREGDKFAPGPKPSELRALIEALERI